MFWNTLFVLFLILDIMSLVSFSMIIFEFGTRNFILLHGLLLMVKDYYFYETGDLLTKIELFFAIYLLLSLFSLDTQILSNIGLVFFLYKIIMSLKA